MNKKNKASVLIDTILLLLLIAIAFCLIFPLKQESVKCSCGNKCYNKMHYLRMGFTEYQLDLGRQVFYPQKQGQGFITTLYQENILVEWKTYLCPETTDQNNQGEDLANAMELGDDIGPVSYAGRDNRDQFTYPGFFKISDDTSTTPILSDDFGPLQKEKPPQNENHRQGRLRYILFLDGHTDSMNKNDGDFASEILFDVLKN